MKHSRKTVGLALGSGGVKGLAHVGVIRSLLRHNIPIDMIAGSSIGAWVAAHYGLFQDLGRLEEYTVGKKEEKWQSFMEPGLGGGLIKGQRVLRMLNTWLEHSTFRNTKIPVRIVTTDLISGRRVVFDDGPLALAVQASMAIPALFRPIRHGEMLLVDGGVTDPVPDGVLKDMGADIVVAVNLEAIPGRPEMALGRSPTMSSIMNRTFQLMRHHLATYSMQQANIIVSPPLANYASWRNYFTKDVGREIVAVGEHAMDAQIPSLKKLLEAE